MKTSVPIWRTVSRERATRLVAAYEGRLKQRPIATNDDGDQVIDWVMPLASESTEMPVYRIVKNETKYKYEIAVNAVLFPLEGSDG